MDIDKRLIPPYAIFSIGLLLSFPLRSSEGLGSPRFLCVYASILVVLYRRRHVPHDQNKL